MCAKSANESGAIFCRDTQGVLKDCSSGCRDECAVTEADNRESWASEAAYVVIGCESLDLPAKLSEFREQVATRLLSLLRRILGGRRGCGW